MFQSDRGKSSYSTTSHVLCPPSPPIPTRSPRTFRRCHRRRLVVMIRLRAPQHFSVPVAENSTSPGKHTDPVWQVIVNPQKVARPTAVRWLGGWVLRAGLSIGCSRSQEAILRRYDDVRLVSCKAKIGHAYGSTPRSRSSGCRI